jgi:hypothetical protein
MSHAIPDDATVAGTSFDMAFGRHEPAGPVSWRLALVIIGSLSTAGWIAGAMALRGLIG